MGRDRQGELLDIQLDQRDTEKLRIGDADRVERDVDAARLVDHGLQMLVHRLLVERVDLRRLGGSAGGLDVLGDDFDWCQVAPGEKELGALGREGACDRTADRASRSVDHRNLVLQHHLWFPFAFSGAHIPFRAVDDVDPAPPGKWARDLRPVRGSAGIDTEVDTDSERREARVEW